MNIPPENRWRNPADDKSHKIELVNFVLCIVRIVIMKNEITIKIYAKNSWFLLIKS
jgi:hypothetical protein